MAEESKSKWEGKASAELAGTTAEQLWPLVQEFCNIHKWIPIETCYQVEGVPGQPGLIRYCAATTTDDAEPERTLTIWAKEKLLTMDPIQRCFTYEVVDSNMGLRSYVATIKVLPIIGINRDDKSAGCKIEWSFACDPVEGRWSFERLFAFIQSCIQSMANKMELACSATQS